MKRLSGGIGCAAVLACSVAAFAQETPQPPSTATSASATEVTITGCIQREADYRRARDAGKGGAAGTGIGAGNEFILVDASTDAKSGTATATPPAPTGTAGASTMAYELTGANEGKLADHVGKRVEIRGTLKAAETTAGGQPTGGATAGKPPSGVDVASKDLKLRELEVASVKEATGTCPSIK